MRKDGGALPSSLRRAKVLGEICIALAACVRVQRFRLGVVWSWSCCVRVVIVLFQRVTAASGQPQMGSNIHSACIGKPFTTAVEKMI